MLTWQTEIDGIRYHLVLLLGLDLAVYCELDLVFLVLGLVQYQHELVHLMEVV